MMRATRDCRDVPELQSEFNVPRFIWHITPLWHAVKYDKTNLEEFWNGQETLLRDFDAKNPNMKRAAGRAPAHPVELVPIHMNVMVAKNSRPPFEIPAPAPAPAPAAPAPASTSAPAPAPAPSPAIISQPVKPGPSPALSPQPATPVPPQAGPSKHSTRTRPMTPPPPVASSSVQRRTFIGTIRRPLEEESDEYVPEPAPAQARKDKGKQREVLPEEKIKVRPPASQVEKKRASPKSSGQQRDRACKRCVKRSQTCYSQAGGNLACLYCAQIKMRCESATDEEEEEAEGVVRVIRPAPATSTVPSKRVAEDSTPGPSKKRAPKKKPAPARNVKRQPAPAPALGPSPAPAPSGSNQRDSRYQELSDDDVPATQPSLRDLETYYGMH